MAKVGAISKAQKCKKGDPSGFVKLQLVAKFEKKIEGGPFGYSKKIPKKIFLNEIFEQCHSAEKCKRGDPLQFFDIHYVAKYQTNEGGPFDAIQKVSKSLSAEKKWGNGGSLVCFRGSGRLFCFFFSFWARF